jgi:hypothetical protein
MPGRRQYDRGFVVLLVAGTLLVLVMPIAYMLLLWLLLNGVFS